MSKKKDIFSRLTDPSTFKGTHAHRFDKDGRGKGKEGRTEQKIADLSDITRGNLRGQEARSSGTSGIDLSDVQKFGTQAAKSKAIWVFQNGDKHHQGVKITLNRGINSMEKLMKAATDALTLPTGVVRKLFRVAGPHKHVKASTLERIQDGGLYLACGPEQIDKAKYPRALLEKAKDM